MKDKELRKLIGSRIKQRRLELNLTQPYVAEKMGVTAVSYTHLATSKPFTIIEPLSGVSIPPIILSKVLID